MWEIRQGHVLTRLREMPDESVHCVVTSPPYFGLRDYGIDGQIGLEATPDEYVAKLVEVFGEARRVLRSDGTLWLNIGDSYANDAKWGGASGGKHATALHGDTGIGRGRKRTGLKGKDLIGIPWLLAFALRADGWYLRSDIIWAKPNPMPESVTDRPTSAHEHIFLLAKSARYFYDADAIRETDGGKPSGNGFVRSHRLSYLGRGQEEEWTPGGGRNKRNVWEVATQPYADAHFATFPPKLVEPCVLAGSSPRCCGACGAPWRRVTERVESGWDGSAYGERAVEASGGALSGGTERSTLGSANGKLTAEYRTVGWESTCEHGDDSGRALVLDPFAGSGTVGVVCGWHSRDFLGIELSSEYAEMARRRIVAEGPLGRAASRPRALPAEHLSLFDP